MTCVDHCGQIEQGAACECCGVPAATWYVGGYYLCDSCARAWATGSYIAAMSDVEDARGELRGMMVEVGRG